MSVILSCRSGESRAQLLGKRVRVISLHIANCTQRTTYTSSKEDAAEIAVRKSLRGMRGRKGMGKQDNELMETFRQERLMPDETLEAHIKGWLDKPARV